MPDLTKEEIEKLFNELKDEYLPPVIDMKPSEIEKMGEENKANYKFQFNTSLQVYVNPLEKMVINLLNNANKEKYSYNVDDLSISERVKLFSDILVKSGYSKEEVDSLVPRTEEEFDIIADAISNGFDDSNILKNEIRVAEAKNYLLSLYEEENQSRRIA